MNATWAATLPRESLAAASALRLKPVEVCEAPAQVWLRGAEPLEPIQFALAALPGAALFDVAPDGLATPAGARVPAARLPDGPWLKLSDVVSVAAPAASLPGRPAGKIPLRLVRSDRVREANLIVCAPEAWRDFALATSAVRLRPLKFALSASHALVWGRPLPAIAGTQYVEEQGLATPSGLALAPLADPEILRPLLGLATGDLALFHEQAPGMGVTWEVIVGGLFVPAARSAVRQSFKRAESDAT